LRSNLLIEWSGRERFLQEVLSLIILSAAKVFDGPTANFPGILETGLTNLDDLLGDHFSEKGRRDP
jgi:hypothetical protein